MLGLGSGLGFRVRVAVWLGSVGFASLTFGLYFIGLKFYLDPKSVCNG